MLNNNFLNNYSIQYKLKNLFVDKSNELPKRCLRSFTFKTTSVPFDMYLYQPPVYLKASTHGACKVSAQFRRVSPRTCSADRRKSGVDTIGLIAFIIRNGRIKRQMYCNSIKNVVIVTVLCDYVRPPLIYIQYNQ